MPGIRAGRRVSSVGLLAGGILLVGLGLLFLTASFMAMGPEDRVPLVAWILPLTLGLGMMTAGILLWPRSAFRAPPGGW